MTKQRTIRVNGEKIVIRSRRLTAGGAHGGFSVVINGVSTKHFVLTREEAEDAAFAAWVKGQVK